MFRCNVCGTRIVKGRCEKCKRNVEPYHSEPSQYPYDTDINRLDDDGGALSTATVVGNDDDYSDDCCNNDCGSDQNI